MTIMLWSEHFSVDNAYLWIELFELFDNNSHGSVFLDTLYFLLAWHNGLLVHWPVAGPLIINVLQRPRLGPHYALPSVCPPARPSLAVHATEHLLTQEQTRTENHSKIKFHTHIPHAMCKWPCYFSPQGQRSRFYQMNCTITDERLDVSSNWVKSLPHDFIPRTRISHLGKVTRSNALLSICVIDASFSLSFFYGVAHALFACQHRGLLHRLAKCATPRIVLVYCSATPSG